MYNERLKRIFNTMKRRCYCETSKGYKMYGARGIRICDEWLSSYENFREWALSNGYSDELSIDRIDVNGNYEPNNCRWATAREQANNRRSNVFITVNGITRSMAEWGRINNIPRDTIWRRINVWNWDMESAVTIPIRGRNERVGKTGEKYIVERKNHKSVSYVFMYKHKTIGTFKTIEEAALCRDKYFEKV